MKQRAVVSPAYVYETDEDEGPLEGDLPSDPCLMPNGNAGLATISPECRAFLVGVRNQVDAGSFINTEPIVDGDRRLGAGGEGGRPEGEEVAHVWGMLGE